MHETLAEQEAAASETNRIAKDDANGKTDGPVTSSKETNLLNPINDSLPDDMGVPHEIMQWLQNAMATFPTTTEVRKVKGTIGPWGCNVEFLGMLEKELPIGGLLILKD